MKFRDSIHKAGNLFADKIPLNWLIAATQERFILPFYHIASNENCPHIKHLYSVKNVTTFEKELDFLLQNYQPISVQEIDKIQPHKNYFLLSFDDGLREMYEVVMPILIRKGIPAIFFVNSQFVDNRALMFRYKVSLLIEAFSKEKNVQKRKEIAQLCNSQKLDIFLKSFRKDEPIIQTIANLLEVDFIDFLHKQKPYLTIPELQKMKANGFEIGAHSHSHPYYMDLTLAAQLEETKKSTIFLKENLDIESPYFAFPFTDFNVSQSYFELQKSELNVRYSFGGAGFKKDEGLNNLQRLALERGNASAETIIKSEYLYCAIKKFLGKNLIHRTHGN